MTAGLSRCRVRSQEASVSVASSGWIAVLDGGSEAGDGGEVRLLVHRGVGDSARWPSTQPGGWVWEGRGEVSLSAARRAVVRGRPVLGAPWGVSDLRSEVQGPLGPCAGG